MKNTSTQEVNSFDDTIVADAEPVAAKERNHAIDMLRGVAVLGILVMNIYAFAMPAVATSNPLAYGGTEPWNLATWFVTHIFFDSKFMTIFSMLFGAGLVMMMQRASERGRHYVGVWYRRCFWLMLFGIVHGYVIWMGDILYSYAAAGMIVFLFRRLSPQALLKTAIVVMAVAPLIGFTSAVGVERLQILATEIEAIQVAGEPVTDEQEALLKRWHGLSILLGDPADQVADDLEGYSGSYIEAFNHRRPTTWKMQTEWFAFYILWRAGGVMLLGMALMKLGIISGEKTKSFYRKLMWLGYGIGLPIVVFGAWNLWQHQWETMWVHRSGSIPNYIGSVFVALGHIGLIMTVIKSGALHKLMDRFAAVGRMAFTNYLSHSIILTTIFYGYGLGLYGSVPRLFQMGFVLAVIGLQLWWSPIWLKSFRFGPAEWLWRSLTYWKLQPMRRDVAS